MCATVIIMAITVTSSSAHKDVLVEEHVLLPIFVHAFWAGRVQIVQSHHVKSFITAQVSNSVTSKV